MEGKQQQLPRTCPLIANNFYESFDHTTVYLTGTRVSEKDWLHGPGAAAV